jgi:hypothetical protein
MDMNDKLKCMVKYTATYFVRAVIVCAFTAAIFLGEVYVYIKILAAIDWVEPISFLFGLILILIFNLAIGRAYRKCYKDKNDDGWLL